MTYEDKNADGLAVEGMSHLTKIGLIAGALGFTGLLAYWCREGGPLGGAKKASGPRAFPYATPTFPIGSAAWYDWMSQHRAQGSVIPGTLTHATTGWVTPGVSETAVGAAPTYAVGTHIHNDDYPPREAQLGSWKNGNWRRVHVTGMGPNDPFSWFWIPDHYFRESIVAGLAVDPEDFDQVLIQAAPEYASWRAQWGETFWERPEWITQFGSRFWRIDEEDLQAAPEYASWHAEWGDNFWERPEWRNQFGSRFWHVSESAVRSAPEYASWHAKWGDNFWKRPDWKAQYGGQFRGPAAISRSGVSAGRRGSEGSSSDYHESQSWAATQAAEAASRKAAQSGSAQDHQTAANSHQYAASSHQAAVSALESEHSRTGSQAHSPEHAPKSGSAHPTSTTSTPPTASELPTTPATGTIVPQKPSSSTGSPTVPGSNPLIPSPTSPTAPEHPSQGGAGSGSSGSNPLIPAAVASHQAAAASHEAAAQAHTSASKLPPGSPAATQHAANALTHATTATQHAAAAHHG